MVAAAPISHADGDDDVFPDVFVSGKLARVNDKASDSVECSKNRMQSSSSSLPSSSEDDSGGITHHCHCRIIVVIRRR